MITFEEMNVSEEIIKSLNENDIENPTPIQEQTIPLLIGGSDVIGQAQTGTGKTFAYAIPMLEKILENKKCIQALILCPTRELSIQVGNEIQKLAKYKKINYAILYGGQSYEIQYRSLAKKPQIIIGTPGRIIDHLNRGKVSFSEVDYLVLDEADEMLKMGFQEDLETILEGMPTLRQTALFSATLPPYIQKLSQKYMFHPQMVQIQNKSMTVDKITQYLYVIKREDKQNLLIRILDYYQFNSGIIFANTKSKVDEITVFLQENHFKADALHGDLKQDNRDRVMRAFRNHSVEILVATDVAARGLDIDGVEAIINFDLPQETEVYVHRIGRTGRAGEAGVAISFATPREHQLLAAIEKYARTKMKQLEVPSVKDIELKRKKRLTEQILSGIDEAKDNHQYDLMLSKLAAKTSDARPIIVRLLSLIDAAEGRTYPEISTMKLQKKKSFSSKNVTIMLNAGSKNRIRTKELVQFMHDQLKIHREHFGKIIVKPTTTFIELNEDALPFLKGLSSKKYAGKVLNYKIVKEMPR